MKGRVEQKPEKCEGWIGRILKENVDNESKVGETEGTFIENLHQLKNLELYFDGSELTAEKKELVIKEANRLKRFFKGCGLEKNETIVKAFTKIDPDLAKSNGVSHQVDSLVGKLSKEALMPQPPIMALNEGLINYIGAFLSSFSEKRNFLFASMGSWRRSAIITGSVDLSFFSRVSQDWRKERFFSIMVGISSLKLGRIHPEDTIFHKFFLKPRSQLLTGLDVSDNKLINDECLQKWSAALGNLISLSLSKCTSVTDSGLESLADCFRKLTRLDLSGCTHITEKGLQALKTSGVRLTSLNLSSTSIQNEGVKLLWKFCQGLTYLNLSYTKITKNGTGFLHGFSRLMTLDLSGLCLMFTNADKLIVKRPIELSFSKNTSLYDHWLGVLANDSPNLTRLNVSGCTRITDIGLLKLAKSPHLTSLNVSGCRKITNTGLEVIVKGCPQLKTLIGTKGKDSLDRIKAEIELKKRALVALTDIELKEGVLVSIKLR